MQKDKIPTKEGEFP